MKIPAPRYSVDTRFYTLQQFLGTQEQAALYVVMSPNGLCAHSQTVDFFTHAQVPIDRPGIERQETAQGKWRVIRARSARGRVSNHSNSKLMTGESFSKSFA